MPLGQRFKQIAQTVGVSRETVYRYLSLAAPPERKRPVPVTAAADAVRARISGSAGRRAVTTNRSSCENLLGKGYRHGASNVFRFLKQLETEEEAGRQQSGAAIGPRHRAISLAAAPAVGAGSRSRTGLSRAPVAAQSPTIATAYRLAQAFAQMTRERQGQNLQGWPGASAGQWHQRGVRYARGLEGIWPAVDAASGWYGVMARRRGK